MNDQELAFLTRFLMSHGIIAYDESSKTFHFQDGETDEEIGSGPFLLPALREAMENSK